MRGDMHDCETRADGTQTGVRSLARGEPIIGDAARAFASQRYTDGVPAVPPGVARETTGLVDQPDTSSDALSQCLGRRSASQLAVAFPSGDRRTRLGSRSSGGSSDARRVGTLEPVAAAGCTCERCTTDRAFLTAAERPTPPADLRRALRAVDLFAGCGGMTCGLEEAARRAGRNLDVVLAIELESLIGAVYQANFPTARLVTGNVASLFDGELGAPKTATEQLARYATGDVDVVVAGPPCQGHSDLNNHTRREDPKNALYARVARVAEVLRPRLVAIENVPPVQWDKGGIVDTTRTHLEKLGYSVHAEVVDLRYAGVPQTRKRYLLVASKLDAFVPLVELGALQSSWGVHGARTVEWAIGDLVGHQGDAPFNVAAKSSSENKRRIDYLFDENIWDLPDDQRPDCHRLKDHSYKSVYGRLWWDKPAPTVTTGFGSMGQGRYVHPSQRRTITPHEAARLQTFPDWFTWPTTKRTVLSTMIGNAVPPLVTVTLGERIVAAVDATT